MGISSKEKSEGGKQKGLHIKQAGIEDTLPGEWGYCSNGSMSGGQRLSKVLGLEDLS